MQAQGTDRRRHARYDVVQAIYIEVVTPGSRRETQNPIVRCETVDISMRGLRITSPERIEPGTDLNIAVPQDGWVENLELRGVARWVDAADDGGNFWVGLELQDTSRANMEKWFRIVSQMQDD